MSDNGRESPGESEVFWHPAHEWLEEDEPDTEYHPALERESDTWQDDISNEDEQMGAGIAHGRIRPKCIDQ